jgi:hypothetical protein
MKMTNKEKYIAIENGHALQMGRCEYEELMTYVSLHHDVDWGVCYGGGIFTVQKEL